MTHIAIPEAQGGKAVDRLEHVGREQYPAAPGAGSGTQQERVWTRHRTLDGRV